MEPEGSLQHSQQPATCPYSETFAKFFFVSKTVLYTMQSRFGVSSIFVRASYVLVSLNLSP
jgi:hypothetical protein